MNEQYLRPEKSKSVDVRQRSAAWRIHRNSPLAPTIRKNPSPEAYEHPFIRRFRDVRRHADALTLGVSTHVLIEPGRDSVRSMRRNTDAQGFCFSGPTVFNLLLQSRECLICLAVCGPENLLVRDTAEPELTHRLPCRTKVHDLAKARNSGADHLYSAKPR